jgi:hypothetical protein
VSDPQNCGKQSAIVTASKLPATFLAYLHFQKRIADALPVEVNLPTLYKPIVTEGESVWSIPAKVIAHYLSKNPGQVLDRLNFYEEHGRPGEAGGKFDEQIKRAQDEVLAEIVGVLTFAFARAAEPPRGVKIASLKWIEKHPSAAQDYALPGFAEWSLARNYQRADEDMGTYFPDVVGFVPNDFQGTIHVPAEESIVKAASAAIYDLEQGRQAGRPSSEACRILSEGLRPIFLRYNDKITRRSEISSRGDGNYFQVEAGPFFDFVSAAIVPLQIALGERGLKLLKVSSIVRQGRYPNSSITGRF